MHLHPGLTIPTAVACFATLLWYWLRLGRFDVPASRRRIRRFSLVLMGVLLVMLVIGLSFVDDGLHQRAYVVVWTVVILGVLLMIPVALVDAANNLSLYRRERHRMVLESTQEILEAARREGHVP